MIIKGDSRSNGGFYAAHLMRADTNERVEVVEMSGIGARDVRDGFRALEAMAIGTRCKNYFYVASLNPMEHESLTREQWLRSVAITEAQLGLAGQPRMIVQHDKNGRQHWHVVWSRIDADSMTAISDSLTYPKHEAAAREIEQEFGLQPVESVLVKDRGSPRPERTPKDWESFRGQGSGIDPQEVKAEVTALWNAADSGQAFKAALEEAGYILARGDRRDFCVIDRAGDEHSLARRISGTKVAEIRVRLSDIDRDGLPSVAEARELAAANAESDANSGGTTAEPEEKQPTSEPASSPLDAQQAADFLAEPDTTLTEAAGRDLAARLGEPELPEDAPTGRTSGYVEAPYGKTPDYVEAESAIGRDGEPSAGWQTAEPKHGSDQREEHTGWERLAEKVRGYWERFVDFVQDESSGHRQHQQETQAVQEQDAPSAQTAQASPASTPTGETATTTETDAPRGWLSRIFDASRHALHGYRTRDMAELGDGLHEAGDIARDLLRANEQAPPDEPPRDMARPGDKDAQSPAPDSAERKPDTEAKAGGEADARPAAAQPIAPVVTGFERFRALYDAAPTTKEPDAATPATPTPEPPEPELN